MEDCLGGSCLCNWTAIWKSENVCCRCNVLLCNYTRPYNFCNGLIKLYHASSPMQALCTPGLGSSSQQGTPLQLKCVEIKIPYNH